MIDANQGVHLVRSGQFATLLRKFKQGFETNEGGFRSLALEKHYGQGQDATCCSHETPSATTFFLVAYLE
jgi:hypothetical protein